MYYNVLSKVLLTRIQKGTETLLCTSPKLMQTDVFLTCNSSEPIKQSYYATPNEILVTAFCSNIKCIHIPSDIIRLCLSFYCNTDLFQDKWDIQFEKSKRNSTSKKSTHYKLMAILLAMHYIKEDISQQCQQHFLMHLV